MTHQQQQQSTTTPAAAAGGGNLQEQMASAMERVNEAAHTMGQKVTDFFQGDPFGTPVGRKIELATDATRMATENWGLNMEICDFINCTNEGPRDAVRAIKKRLQTQMGKNNAIVMYTLTVLETCVKNCDERFAVLVTNKEFVGELVKLISTKHDAPQIVQERVLGIIQSWADAFRENPALCGVVELYDEFRAKGVEFPATNFDAMAPIITPKQTVFPSENELRQKQQANAASLTFPPPPDATRVAQVPQRQQPRNFVGGAANGGGGPVAATPEQMAKLRSELDIVQVNLTVLRELVSQMKPNSGGEQPPQPPEDFHFIQELYATCREMQKRILELIPNITNEEVTFELLSVNDELNATFEKYDRCMANFNAHGVDVSMVASGSGTAAHQQRKTEAGGGDLLIDLGDEKKPAVAATVADQFQSIDIHNGSGGDGTPATKGGGGGGVSNEAYVHDQAELPIRSVAYNKPEPTTDQPEERGVEEGKPKKPLVDDGL